LPSFSFYAKSVFPEIPLRQNGITDKLPSHHLISPFAGTIRPFIHPTEEQLGFIQAQSQPPLPGCAVRRTRLQIGSPTDGQSPTSISAPCPDACQSHRLDMELGCLAAGRQPRAQQPRGLQVVQQVARLAQELAPPGSS
jgi:hypothetical protein